MTKVVLQHSAVPCSLFDIYLFDPTNPPHLQHSDPFYVGMIVCQDALPALSYPQTLVFWQGYSLPLKAYRLQLYSLPS